MIRTRMALLVQLCFSLLVFFTLSVSAQESDAVADVTPLLMEVDFTPTPLPQAEATPAVVSTTPEPVSWTPEPVTHTPEPVAVTPEPVKESAQPDAASAQDGSTDASEKGSDVHFAMNEWRPKPKYPLAVLESAGGVLRTADGAKLLMVAGGYIDNSALLTTSKAYVLNLNEADAVWERVADMPLHLTHCAQAFVGDRLYVCGGFLSKAPGRSIGQCYVYSYGKNEWDDLPKLPLAVGGGGMVYISQMNALLFSSGMIRHQDEWHGEDSAQSFMLHLDDLERGWVRKADIFNARNHMSAVSVLGRYFFVGGQKGANEEHGNQQTVQEYDFKKDEWLDRAPLPMGLGHIAASTFRYGKGFFVIAGVTNGRKPVDAVLYYDAVQDAWRTVGKYWRAVQSAVCGAADGALYCTTGRGHPGRSDETYWRRVSKL